MSKIYTYDTTLRDGTQREGISLSLDDKLKITQKLDEFGIDYIEGGWPGSNPKDVEYFNRVQSLELKHAKVTAFGSTRRKGSKPEEDLEPEAVDRGANAGDHPGRQELGSARRRCAGNDDGREPGDDWGECGVLQGARP
jgi:isopropylmalate/homocitrate/citramalate synthase